MNNEVRGYHFVSFAHRTYSLKQLCFLSGLGHVSVKPNHQQPPPPHQTGPGPNPVGAGQSCKS